MIIAQVKQ